MSGLAVFIALGALVLIAGIVTRQNGARLSELLHTLDMEQLGAVQDDSDALRERIAGCYVCRLGHGWSSSSSIRWARADANFQACRLSYDRGFGLRTERRNVLVVSAGLAEPAGRWLRLPEARPFGEPEYDFYRPVEHVPTVWTLDGEAADAERIGGVFATVGESLLATAGIEVFDRLMIVWWEDDAVLDDAGRHVLAAVEFHGRFEGRNGDASSDDAVEIIGR